MRMKVQTMLSCFYLLLLLGSGCSPLPEVKQAGTTLAPTADRQPSIQPRREPVDLASASRVTALLQQQYSEWAGTPHQWGGMSKQGVDCSAFVYITYREKLGYTPPRTTDSMVQWGRQVDYKRLQPADLLVFRTGIKARHVGIYLGNRQFMHVSSRRGVMISSLDDDYWNQRFWQARRPVDQVAVIPPSILLWPAPRQCPLPAAGTLSVSAAKHWPAPAAISPLTPA